MAVKFCTVPGCKKMAQHGCEGLCKAHFSAAQREAGVTAPVVAADVVEPPAIADVPVVDWDKKHAAIAVEHETYAALFDVDPVIRAALADAWQAKEAEWLTELSGLKPGKAVCYAAAMVAAIEALGY